MAHHQHQLPRPQLHLGREAPGRCRIRVGKLAKNMANHQHQLPRPQPDLGREAGQRQSASSASVAQAASESWPKTERVISISCCPGRCRIWAGKLAKDRAHHQHQLPRPQPDWGSEAGQRESASLASVAEAAAGFGQGSWPKTERIISISCPGRCPI